MFKKFLKKKKDKATKQKIAEKKPTKAVKKIQKPIEELKPIKESNESSVKEKTLSSKILTAEGWLRRLK